MENIKPLKEKISISVDAEVIEQIRKEADRDERSLSQFINLILKRYIASLNDD